MDSRDDYLLASNMFQGAPSILQQQTLDGVMKNLEATTEVISVLEDGRMRTLLEIKNSKRYNDYDISLLIRYIEYGYHIYP